MHKDRSRDEYYLERVESIMIGDIQLLENVLLGQICQ